ncbi:MAG TPA: hypothetical protein VFS21_08190 [Roseiflexaceae bacterium]|nr:hypothetical protein [Roseiflexaceae bacterium]
MLHYRLVATPERAQGEISADLHGVLPHVTTLSTTLLVVRPPHRDPGVTVWVLTVPEVFQTTLERRFAPRWFGSAPAPFQRVRGVALRPEWRYRALLVPRPGAAPLGSVLTPHWPSFRLDTWLTERHVAAALWSTTPSTVAAVAAIREAGWRLWPLERWPARVRPLLERLALQVGRAPELRIDLGQSFTDGAKAAPEEAVFPTQLPPAETPAARLLAEAWTAGQQEPPARTPIAGADGAGDSTTDTTSRAATVEQYRGAEAVEQPGDVEVVEDDPLEGWPNGPGQLRPRMLAAVLERLAADPDVRGQGVTRKRLRSAGAGVDTEALLAWLDTAGALAEPSKNDPVVRWREPRALRWADTALLVAALRKTPLPDEALVDQVRAAFNGSGGGS